MARRIELTDEERSYVVQAAAAPKSSFLSLLVGYLPYLVPVVLFGVYGMAIGDVTAVGLSFVCLVGLMLWWIHGQSQAATLFQAICVKVVAAVAGPPQPTLAPEISDDRRAAADGAEQP